jgi:ComF family protein
VRPVRLLRESLETLADLVYPPHCSVCGCRLEAGRWLCVACSAQVRRIEEPKCRICSRPAEGDIDFFTCPNCRGEALHMDFAVSVMRSQGPVRDLIHRFKYGREFPLRRVLGDWLVEAFADERLAAMENPVLVPVPLHPARFRDRRFNQSAALAEWVARRRELRWEEPLRRIVHTATQTRFDRRQRMRNLRGAFALRHNARVKEKSFLLVDDVMTTGSTLDECARVLLEGGAGCVRAITVARG